MALTYNWQEQPIIKWKGLTNNSVVPSWTRADYDSVSGDSGVAFKARPLKIWRKQLNGKNSRGRSAVGMPMDTPGGSVNLGSGAICDDDNHRIGLVDEINHGIQIQDPKPEDTFFDEDAGKTVCVACNPENHVIKTASTIVDKKYYTDSRAYLQSRGRTYAQNQATGSKVDGLNYFDSNGKPLHPSDDTNKGPPNYNKTSGDQSHCSDSKLKQLIYKPNNQKFSTQGAVSSGSRLLRLKVDTINNNAQSFASAYGLAAQNAGRYSANSNAIYFLKSKHNKCSPHRLPGSKRKCDNKTIVNLIFMINVHGDDPSNSFYTFVGQDRLGEIDNTAQNPDINVNAGDTIDFHLTTLNSAHPFFIVIDPNGGTGSNNQVTTPTFEGQGKTSENWSWTPQKGTYYYLCSSHSVMNGKIIVS